MRRDFNFGNTIAEILRKSRREEREMMWQIYKREKGILVMKLPKKKKNLNCGNWIAKIRGLKKKENWTVARVMLRPQTILLYFYKLLLWPIFY